MIKNIEKNYFYKMENISSIKDYEISIKDIIIKDDQISGVLDLCLNYYDKLSELKKMNLDIDFEISQLFNNIEEVRMMNSNIYLIEGNGIDIEYELEINYSTEDKVEVYEDIKEQTKEYYEEMLEQNLRENIEIIKTVTDNTVEDFLDFFDDLDTFSLKCVYIDDIDELDEISELYNIDKSILLSGYDEGSKKVIFSVK